MLCFTLLMKYSDKDERELTHGLNSELRRKPMKIIGLDCREYGWRIKVVR
ncbi:Uncharacterised protein [Vibrio cholerae]|nr:Uncharacterised protein [Vibrio cholerae]CSC43801.1 Uncharacterised protein [Vibrio cholerae]